MQALVEIAARAAREAGALLRERFEQPRTGVDVKSSSTDMVTDADRAAEKLITGLLRDARPDDAIMGEEGADESGTSGLRWIVDPLDGTTNFLFGLPQWSVSIACFEGDDAAAGAVYDPMRDEMFTAARGEGAALNGAPIEVTGAADLSRALLATGFSYLPEERATQARMLAHILPRVRDVRRAGSAALDLAWTAAGRFDGFYEVPIQLWDRAAGMLLIREAGGAAEELEAIGPSGEGAIAAGPALFAPLRDLVAAARDAG